MVPSSQTTSQMPVAPRTVAIVTLGCARNEVDSEEVAGRLAGEGWILVDDPAQAEAVLVNTCGFVEAAKKDSIDAILAAADLKGDGSGPTAVVAMGCMSERYGRELAQSLPEADAVLGFDDYEDIGATLTRIVQGEQHVPHAPTDRRRMLPVSPVDRPAAAGAVPGHGTVRRRLDDKPVAPVKLASGCDRRCSFCAIPSFRGSFVSRRPSDVLEEVTWLALEGVREVVLVSENSTSYGKDLGDMRLLESLLGSIAEHSRVSRVRVAYLQPAEVRAPLLAAMAANPVVAPYFDLSFQHGSPTVLRRMRRFGGREDFMRLIGEIRALSPLAGIRSNVIVGFPGETQEEFDDLLAFIEEAKLDAIGVFGYSDEEGTEAAGFADKVDDDTIAERVRITTDLAEEVMAQRAEDRIGELVEVLIEEHDVADDGTAVAVGHAGHQGADDGVTVVVSPDLAPVGTMIVVKVVGTDGVDLIAEPV